MPPSCARCDCPHLVISHLRRLHIFVSFISFFLNRGQTSIRMPDCSRLPAPMDTRNTKTHNEPQLRCRLLVDGRRGWGLGLRYSHSVREHTQHRHCLTPVYCLKTVYQIIYSYFFVCNILINIKVAARLA